LTGDRVELAGFDSANDERPMTNDRLYD
jgi:hypothetical protein